MTGIAYSVVDARAEALQWSVDPVNRVLVSTAVDEPPFAVVTDQAGSHLFIADSAGAVHAVGTMTTQRDAIRAAAALANGVPIEEVARHLAGEHVAPPALRQPEPGNVVAHPRPAWLGGGTDVYFSLGDGGTAKAGDAMTETGVAAIARAVADRTPVEPWSLDWPRPSTTAITIDVQAAPGDRGDAGIDYTTPEIERAQLAEEAATRRDLRDDRPDRRRVSDQIEGLREDLRGLGSALDLSRMEARLRVLEDHRARLANEEARAELERGRVWLEVPRAAREEAVQLGARVDLGNRQIYLPPDTEPATASRILARFPPHAEASRGREYLRVPDAGIANVMAHGGRFDGIAGSWYIPPGTAPERATALRLQFSVAPPPGRDEGRAVDSAQGAAIDALARRAAAQRAAVVSPADGGLGGDDLAAANITQLRPRQLARPGAEADEDKAAKGGKRPDGVGQQSRILETMFAILEDAAATTAGALERHPSPVPSSRPQLDAAGTGARSPAPPPVERPAAMATEEVAGRGRGGAPPRPLAVPGMLSEGDRRALRDRLETYDSDALSSLGEATARHYRSQAAKPSLSMTESRMRDEYRSGARLIAAELERRGLPLPPHLQKLIDTSAKADSKRSAGRGGQER